MRKTVGALGRVVSVCWVLAMCLGASRASASDVHTSYASEDGASEGVRTLSQHTFLFPQLQPTAFVATYAGIREGVGIQSINQVPLGPLGQRSLQLAGLAQSLDFGLRFTSWLGMFLSADGRVIVGVNPTTLITRAATSEAGLQTGPVFKLWRGTRGQLGARVYGAVANTHRLSLLPLLENLTSEPGNTISNVLDGNLKELVIVPGKTGGLGGDLSLAYTFSRPFSVQLSLGLQNTWRVEHPYDVSTGERRTLHGRTFLGRGAVALTFDASAYGVPVAVLAEYLAEPGHTFNAFDLENSGFDNSLAAGIYYTGRRSLQLGVGGTLLLSGSQLPGFAASGAIVNSESMTFGALNLNLRYVW